MLLIFLDGVGLAPPSPENPFARFPTPGIERILGGPLTTGSMGSEGDRLLAAIDATLGVDGLPQSATGQTALFSGCNAAQSLGHHATGFPGPRMRALLAQGNLFQAARRGGLSAIFANAYSPGYWREVQEGRRRASVTTIALMSSGIRPLDIEDLAAGRALSWDVRRDHFRRRLAVDVPQISARRAGRDLGIIAGRHRLTVFESFLTDMAGHHRAGFTAGDTIDRLDRLFAGLAETLSREVTLIVTSDHGNFEEMEHRRHTRNPVPLWVSGALAARFGAVESIAEVTPTILSVLGVEPDSTP